MKIRAVVFEFIACRQTDRRGGGLCFIICIDDVVTVNKDQYKIFKFVNPVEMIIRLITNSMESLNERMKISLGRGGKKAMQKLKSMDVIFFLNNIHAL